MPLPVSPQVSRARTASPVPAEPARDVAPGLRQHEDLGVAAERQSPDVAGGTGERCVGSSGTGPTSLSSQAWFPELAELGTTQFVAWPLAVSVLVRAARGMPRSTMRAHGEDSGTRRERDAPDGRAAHWKSLLRRHGSDPKQALAESHDQGTPVIQRTSGQSRFSEPT